MTDWRKIEVFLVDYLREHGFYITHNANSGDFVFDGVDLQPFVNITALAKALAEELSK